MVKAAEEMMVLDTHLSAGEHLAAGERAVELASPELEILIEPAEREVGKIFIGQTGRAVVEAAPERPFEVQVANIAPQVDLDRGIIEVKLDIKEERPDLLPYMTVSVDLAVGEE